MFDIFAVLFLGSAVAMVGFVLFLGFLESRNPSDPTVGSAASRAAAIAEANAAK